MEGRDKQRLAAFAAAWLRIGLLGFGGPAGQIALMHRVVVEEQRWLDDKRYLAALNFCMLLPGPEAQQLATYCGWVRHGVLGGLIAGGLFVLPGALVMLALATLYVLHGDMPLVAALFYGIKAAVLALVIEALLRVARRALTHRLHWLLAGLAFLALFLFALPFPLVIVVAGLIGWATTPAPTATTGDLEPTPAAGGRHTLVTTLLCGVIWAMPVLLAARLLGPDHVLTEIGLFFSRMAVVTFGGAYAVLAYVAQAAVNEHHWLTAAEMLDGLGLAETTPGPLVLVLQFVGFLAAWREAAPFTPWLAGLLGAVMTLWATFAPSFLWIFAAAPHLERLRRMPRLQGALAGITAAVVGVILNLGLWFALHLLFGDVGTWRVGPLQVAAPTLSTFDPKAAVLAVLAGLALLRWRVGLLPTLAGGAMAGLALHLLA